MFIVAAGMKVLVTGSRGLIGPGAVLHFDREGHTAVGIDNSLLAELLGLHGDRGWNLERFLKAATCFQHWELDIRDRQGSPDLFRVERY